MRRCGAMTLKFNIVDNSTKYFNRLEKLWEDETEYVLKELMTSATGRLGDRNAPISKRLMEQGRKGIRPYNYNPYLFMSGQDKGHWKIEQDQDQSSITANYSGMRGYMANFDGDGFKVWVEFSEEFRDYIDEGYAWEEAYYIVQHQTEPHDRILDRDYAFYQETGQDEFASPENADHIGYVSEGLQEAAETQIPYTLNSQTKRIFNRVFGK